MNEGQALAEERLAFIREETRFEIGLLHERVNALVAAEAFLTIAFTGAMSNSAPWGKRFSDIVGPTLSILGMLLAVLAWPAIDGTVRIVFAWAARRREIMEQHPELWHTDWGLAGNSRHGLRAGMDDWRSLLFFRTAPGLFAVMWAGLTIVAVTVLRR